jgi:hypothetical protein
MRSHVRSDELNNQRQRATAPFQQPPALHMFRM